MKKLFTFATILALAWGGISCSDSNTDENQTILIPQEALSVSIAADSGLKHTVSFEATEDWQASVQETRSDAWITIDPESGNAGKNDITVTLTENMGDTSRKAVITILCGGKSVSIAITQRGVGEPEDPENPEEPVKPEHPEVVPENRLTYIETTYTTTAPPYPDGSVNISKGYISLSYDKEGKLVSFDEYKFDREQTDKIIYSNKSFIEWGTNKFTETREEVEIYGTGYLPFMVRRTNLVNYDLTPGGLIAAFTDTEVGSNKFTYNADGTLATSEYQEHTDPKFNWKTIYYWNNGDLINFMTTGFQMNSTLTYTYTDILNPWQGVDVGGLVVTRGGHDEIVRLLGISGLTTKHLPQSLLSAGIRYDYTLDAQGRIGTIVVDMNVGGNQNHRTEYKLHYGPQSIPQHDYMPYLLKQEVLDEGTLDYVFSKDEPDKQFFDPDAYTSYVKIRSTFSDGTTQDNTKYETVLIFPAATKWFPEENAIFVTEDDIANFKLEAQSTRKEAGEQLNKIFYTLEYNCFRVEIECVITSTLYCDIYSEESGKMEKYRMPTRPLDEDCLILYDPALEKQETDETMTEYSYLFSQKYLLQINPNVAPNERSMHELTQPLFIAK